MPPLFSHGPLALDKSDKCVLLCVAAWVVFDSEKHKGVRGKRACSAMLGCVMEGI